MENVYWVLLGAAIIIGLYMIVKSIQWINDTYNKAISMEEKAISLRRSLECADRSREVYMKAAMDYEAENKKLKEELKELRSPVLSSVSEKPKKNGEVYAL